MRLLSVISRPCGVLAATMLLALPGGAFPPTAEAGTVGRKDIRAARTTVQEGRLADGLEAYERILASTTTQQQRFESLGSTVIFLLSSGTDAASSELVQGRLDVLGALVASGKYGNEFEIQTLAVLAGSMDALQATVEELSEVQMLQVGVRKNEELAKARLALQGQGKEQANQATQLELKEEEIRQREKAIREVTERVLGKEPPDS